MEPISCSSATGVCNIILGSNEGGVLPFLQHS
jgi:hypothetical protein